MEKLHERGTMPSKPITLANEIFSTQDAAKKKIQAILGSYQPGMTVNLFDSALLLDLVQRHPHADQKIGCGVAGFRVEKTPQYGSKCFILVRTDGATTDFSYLECLRSTPHGAKVTSAFRAAIEPDVFQFKQACFDRAALDGNDPLRCPITGEVLGFVGAHVDHVPPDTFANLLDDFLTGEGKALADLEVKNSADHTYSDRLCDLELEAKWIAFHRFNARLRIVSKTANLLLIPRMAVL